LEFELLPKRKVVPFELIHHHSRFGKFWASGSSYFVFSKFDQLKLEKNRIRERGQPGLAHAAVRPSSPAMAHGPPAISFPDSFSGLRPPGPASPSCRIDSNAPNTKLTAPCPRVPTRLPSPPTTLPFHRVPLLRSHVLAPILIPSHRS
jgi:hypothetical protein